jgi:hypothetical protein
MSNNANNTTGFEVYRHRSGKAVTTIERPLSATAPALHAGSWMRQAAGLLEWTKALAGETIGGFAVGFRYPDANGKEIEKDFVPANQADAFVTMVDDPANCEYFGRLDDDIAVDAETLNFDILNGTDTSQLSLQQIDASTALAATGQLRGVRYLKQQGSGFAGDNALGDDITAAFARLVVRINENQSEPALGTIVAVGTP